MRRAFMVTRGSGRESAGERSTQDSYLAAMISDGYAVYLRRMAAYLRGEHRERGLCGIRRMHGELPFCDDIGDIIIGYIAMSREAHFARIARSGNVATVCRPYSGLSSWRSVNCNLSLLVDVGEIFIKAPDMIVSEEFDPRRPPGDNEIFRLLSGNKRKIVRIGLDSIAKKYVAVCASEPI